MGACALHTVIARNSRRRKELEPSRRLSETTEPRPSGAFRVVFPTPEVTKRGARCKRAEDFSHTPHQQRRPRGFTRYRRASRGAAHVPAPQPSVAHMFPQHSGGTCGRRCSRRWLSNSLVTARATEAMVGVTVFWTMSVSPAQAPVQPATPTANPSHRDTGRCPGQIPALLRRFARCSSHHDAASVPVCGDS